MAATPAVSTGWSGIIGYTNLLAMRSSRAWAWVGGAPISGATRPGPSRVKPISKLRQLWPHLNERSKRMLAAAAAVEIGYGGVSLVSRACGLSRVTLTKGIKELAAPPLPGDRIRRLGGGRWRLTVRDPGLPNVLEALVEPLTRGDPESPLRWTCKSTRTLARELQGRQHPLSHQKVAQLLRAMNYSLPGNRKTEEWEDHPPRDAQFRHIHKELRPARLHLATRRQHQKRVVGFHPIDGGQQPDENVVVSAVERRSDPVLRSGPQQPSPPLKPPSTVSNLP